MGRWTMGWMSDGRVLGCEGGCWMMEADVRVTSVGSTSTGERSCTGYSCVHRVHRGRSSRVVLWCVKMCACVVCLLYINGY